MLNKSKPIPAKEKTSFEKVPVSGEIVGYIITRPTDKTIMGRESIKLTIDTDTGAKTAFIGMSAKMWFQNDLGNGPVWQAPWYTEYNQLKMAASLAGVEFSEDIELIEGGEEKDPKIEIVDIITEPELCGYYIRLGVVESSSKTDSTKKFTNYVVEYLSSVPEVEGEAEPVKKPATTQPTKQAAKVECSAAIMGEFEKYLEFATDLVSPGALSFRGIANNIDKYTEFSAESMEYFKVAANISSIIESFKGNGKLKVDGGANSGKFRYLA